MGNLRGLKIWENLELSPPFLKSWVLGSPIPEWKGFKTRKIGGIGRKEFKSPEWK